MNQFREIRLVLLQRLQRLQLNPEKFQTPKRMTIPLKNQQKNDESNCMTHTICLMKEYKGMNRFQTFHSISLLADFSIRPRNLIIMCCYLNQVCYMWNKRCTCYQKNCLVSQCHKCHTVTVVVALFLNFIFICKNKIQKNHLIGWYRSPTRKRPEWVFSNSLSFFRFFEVAFINHSQSELNLVEVFQWYLSYQ